MIHISLNLIVLEFPLVNNLSGGMQWEEFIKDGGISRVYNNSIFFVKLYCFPLECSEYCSEFYTILFIQAGNKECKHLFWNMLALEMQRIQTSKLKINWFHLTSLSMEGMPHCAEWNYLIFKLQVRIQCSTFSVMHQYKCIYLEGNSQPQYSNVLHIMNPDFLWTLVELFFTLFNLSDTGT